jgi:ubiquitin C-terminal hydrolase
MAVVLPIHNHIDFSNPTEEDYESQCQNEENEAGGERLNENESASGIFANHESDDNTSDNDYGPCHPPLEKEEIIDENDESDKSMDTCGHSDVDGDNANSLPLNDLGVIDDPDRSDRDPIKTIEEDVPLSYVDNYWSMNNEIREIDNVIDENSVYTSSLMSVDVAVTNKDESGKKVEPNESATSNIVDAILMEETDEHKGDNNMEVEINETQKLDSLATAAIMAEAQIVPYVAAPEAEVALVPYAEAPDPSLYGGLNNLGNTCYMASAIQLLCGLDSFPAELKSRIPPENNDSKDRSTADCDSQSLRDALLDVMERLGKGEAVRPNDLKRCIDSRTSLFLGYHQQDSHEFLTTLLDIIDEDYKIKPKPEESTTSQAGAANDETKEEDDPALDAMNEQTSSVVESEANEQESNDDENDCDGNDEDDDEQSLESALKRQKVVEEQTPVSEKENTSATALVNEAAPPIQRSKSFSNFKFSDIESLLHDNDDSSNSARISAESTTAKQDEPKCKLAGGRMSTAGVELTRFVEESGIDEDVRPTGASLDKATPQQQIVEGEDHNDMEESEDTSCSPVSSSFTTKVRVCLTCESCKFRRSHIETYLHLSLDIGTGSNDDENGVDVDVCNLGLPSSSSIEEGLRKFFAPEKRDIKCEKCFHTSALQTSEITQLPRNLLFHLKRFIVDISPDYSSISYRKDQSAVVFEERMELEAGDDEEAEDGAVLRSVHDDEERGFKDFLALDCSYPKGAAYEIRSVVNHIGSSASCGHYTADAKRLPRQADTVSTSKDQEEAKESGTEIDDASSEEEQKIDDANNDNEDDARQWMRFNDSYVSKISSKEAVQDASQTAYMIMYELVHE